MIESKASNTLAPQKPATGHGPDGNSSFSQHNYHHPAAGWAGLRGNKDVKLKRRLTNGLGKTWRQNRTFG
jgi:hypothetical protein